MKAEERQVKRLEKMVDERTKELRESSELYKSLFEFNKGIIENSPAGVIRLNEELKVEYENPEMKKILGVPSEKESKAMGVDIREIPSVKAIGISSIFNDLLEGEKISTEMLFTSLYGKESYLSLSGVPMFNDAKFAGAILLINDITKRKKSEENLKQRVDELQLYQDVTTERELKMVELKREINGLCEKYGEKFRYEVD